MWGLVPTILAAHEVYCLVTIIFLQNRVAIPIVVCCVAIQQGHVAGFQDAGKAGLVSNWAINFISHAVHDPLSLAYFGCAVASICWQLEGVGPVIAKRLPVARGGTNRAAKILASATVWR